MHSTLCPTSFSRCWLVIAGIFSSFMCFLISWHQGLLLYLPLGRRAGTTSSLAPGRHALHTLWGGYLYLSIPSTSQHMSGVSWEEPDWFIYLTEAKADGDRWWWFLPSCPHHCCLPHPTQTVVITWNRLHALQTQGTFVLEAETVLHCFMCYGHWCCHLTTSVLKINPISFQRKQPPSLELLVSM